MTLPSVAHGTAVEQSRAVAEVFAAAELATRFPRNEQRAEQRMRAACSRWSMAEQAEYALPRGSGKDVVGPSVHLARELARIWGNITHGVVEISRDNDRGQSELMAYAWDVETNTRSARTFIVPHTRDKTQWDNSGGRNRRVGTVAEPIETQQDITNQNNSVGARQLRETIFSVLPQWFTEDAIAACRARLLQPEVMPPAGDGGRSLPAPQTLQERVEAAIVAWAGNGITVQQLEGWTGAERARWDESTLVNLQTLWRSLNTGQLTVEQAFAEPAPAAGRPETAVEKAERMARDMAAPAPARPVEDRETGDPYSPADLGQLDTELEPSDDERARYGGGDNG